MKLLRTLYHAALHGGEALEAERDRIMQRISLTAAALMLPFVVNHAIQGRIGMLLAMSVVLLAIVGNYLALRQGRPPPVPYPLLLPPMIFTIGMALAVQGILGALWAYPTLFFCYFVLARRMAFFCSVILVTSVSALTWAYVSFDLALRIGATMVLLWLMIAIVVNVLDDLYLHMREQATTDPMTGALNRRQMDNALSELVKRARGRPVPASILLIDVDNFKRINDQYGHGTGDQVLIGLVKLLGSRKRTVDSLFRIGGEEFLLLLPETAAPAASSVAEQLRDLIEQAPLLKDLAVTISIGVAECQPGLTPDQWLQGADMALYRAKESGRNRVENSVFAETAP